MAAFGLLAGLALTIKPTALPLSLAQLGIAWWVWRRWRPVLVGVAAMMAGPIVALVFLLREHAVAAFVAGLHGMVPYYASLAHRPFGYLLVHSVSPLMPLVIAWLAVLLLAEPKLDWERAVMGCGVVFGLASYVVQAKGFPYHRYPMLAFLLPLMTVDLNEAAERILGAGLRTRAAGLLAVAALLVGGLFLGPQSALLIHRDRWWETDFLTSLKGNLNRLGGSQLSGNIQCIDWVSGCGNTLYLLRLMPASGVLTDFLLFGPDELPAVRAEHAMFREQVFARPPRVIVVSSWLHVEGPDGYRKLARWPELEGFLAARYRLETEWTPSRTNRWWSREELPKGYRIYVLR